MSVEPGVTLPIAAGIVAGLVIGKPLGIVLAARGSVALGWCELPPGVGSRQLLVLGALAGIGFTMSIFVCDLAFAGEALAVAKLGVLVGSSVAAVIGLVLGAIISLTQVRQVRSMRPLAAELAQRCRRLSLAFRYIVFAQVRISLLNTVFTGLFLLVVLPLFGVHLPLSKTLVVATFVAGLLPVIGNLISNTAIVIVALSQGAHVAAASLGYLIVIHKLEYFLNARIIGSHINARAWELLIAMLVMEAAFGIPGLIAAPIFYAYFKEELRAKGMI